MKIVDRPPADTSIVRFGASISLLSSVDGQVDYRIVGVDETNAAKGYISIDSPVARALLGKTVGDAIEVQLPDCMASIEVISVRYL
jgi:transcription elongation factor GreB